PLALEQRVFDHAADSLLGETVDRARTADFLRDFGRRAPAHVAWGLRVVLWLTLLSPLLLVGRARSFLSLSAEECAGLWSKALEHRRYAVRQLALVLKALACLCHFDRELP
ncbi:MAG TPA: hypothetical protein VMV18_13065, partial [bacterium]|nr:hypothetical protein [bacterium]